MIKNEQLPNFKRMYCTTLCKDKDVAQPYIKIPFDGYQQLSLFNYYIAHAIDLVGEAHEHNAQNDELSFTLKYLTHILKHTPMLSECEGLDMILKDGQ